VPDEQEHGCWSQNQRVRDERRHQPLVPTFADA
jgi:hypothetical protein